MEISLQNTNIKIKGKRASVLISLPNVTVGNYQINGPGEYEISGIDVIGLKDDVYRINVDKISVCVMNRKLTEEEKGRLGVVNICLVPVNNSTDPATVTTLEPNYIIPIGTKEDCLAFGKKIGVEQPETLEKLVTSLDKLPETTQVVML